MAHWVYVLQNQKGRFSIGQTQSLSERLANHNRDDVFQGKYTRKNGPWTVVWSEEHSDRSSAMRRERAIKAMKSAKWIRENLLREQSAVNPDVSGAYL